MKALSTQETTMFDEISEASPSDPSDFSPEEIQIMNDAYAEFADMCRAYEHVIAGEVDDSRKECLQRLYGGFCEDHK